jgi:transposase-like protein
MAGRRKFGKAFKSQVVEEFLAGEVTQAQLARRYGISDHLILQWRKRYVEGKLEEVYVSEYRTFAEVKERIGEFIELIYNQQRLHLALGYVSPMEFEQEIKSAQSHVSISVPMCPA